MMINLKSLGTYLVSLNKLITFMMPLEVFDTVRYVQQLFTFHPSQTLHKLFNQLYDYGRMIRKFACNHKCSRWTRSQEKCHINYYNLSQWIVTATNTQSNKLEIPPRVAKITNRDPDLTSIHFSFGRLQLKVCCHLFDPVDFIMQRKVSCAEENVCLEFPWRNTYMTPSALSCHNVFFSLHDVKCWDVDTFMHEFSNGNKGMLKIQLNALNLFQSNFNYFVKCLKS